MSDIRALFAFAAPHRAALGLSALLMLCESGAALLVPWAGGLLADAMLLPAGAAPAGVGIVLSGMLGLFALQAVLKFGNTYILGNAADKIVSDPKIRLYDHLQALPLAYYQEWRLGDTLALLTNDVDVLTGYISGTVLALAPLLFTAGGAVILMFRIRPSLALLAVVLIPLFYLLMKIAGRRMRPLASADLGEGELLPAQLMSFLLYAALLTRPVAGLADVYGQTQMARGAFTRLRQAIEEPAEPAAHIGEPLPKVTGEIEFRGVSFAYAGRPPALEKVDLHIAAGETVAIVGPNGASKSTLGHLLMRLHEPSAGRILIDGIDTAGVSLASLRGQIGVVPQHVLLFNTTVRDNIAYGRPEPAQAEIEAAARAARAHDFIAQLPQGYDTLIGDRGVRLSGGQQQRVALARALLKDPPILILDEATAMFDPQGEAEFLETCRDALKRRTVLLITHRPASLVAADRIVRVEQARIIEA